VGCAKIRQLLRLPGTRGHSMSCLEDDFGKNTAKAARTSSNKPNIVHNNSGNRLIEVALRASSLFSLFGPFLRTRNYHDTPFYVVHAPKRKKDPCTLEHALARARKRRKSLALTVRRPGGVRIGTAFCGLRPLRGECEKTAGFRSALNSKAFAAKQDEVSRSTLYAFPRSGQLGSWEKNHQNQYR
jgi:hypothetical protein